MEDEKKYSQEEVNAKIQLVEEKYALLLKDKEEDYNSIAKRLDFANNDIQFAKNQIQELETLRSQKEDWLKLKERMEIENNQLRNEALASQAMAQGSDNAANFQAIVGRLQFYELTLFEYLNTFIMNFDYNNIISHYEKMILNPQIDPNLHPYIKELTEVARGLKHLKEIANKRKNVPQSNLILH